MKELNLRKKKFYSSAMRSFILLVVLIILLTISKDINMLQNQKIVINKGEINQTIVTGVEIAKAILSLLIIGILLNFALIAETQLPFIIAKIPQSGKIVSSVFHIGVIFIAYIYLLPFATDKLKNVNQIFNAIFLLLLCIPLFRGGKALYEGIDVFLSGATEEAFGESKSLINNAPQFIVCKNCNAENAVSAKHCIECGNNLRETKTTPKFIICPQCSEENKPNAKHCSECGTDLTKTTAKQM